VSRELRTPAFSVTFFFNKDYIFNLGNWLIETVSRELRTPVFSLTFDHFTRRIFVLAQGYYCT